jgi:hypothetical protein
VSAAQNLLVLLGSLQAGPRLISPLLPEIRRSVEVTPEALGSLLQASHLLHEGPAQLLCLAQQRFAAELAEALRSAEAQPLEARPRLALQATFARLVPCLDAARELAELLALVSEPGVELDLSELLDATFAPSSRSGLRLTPLQLSLAAPPRGVALIQTGPRGAPRLLRLLLGYTRGSPEHPWNLAQASLQAPPQAPASCLFSDHPSPRADTILASVPLLIPPTLPVLTLFCSLTRLRLTADDSSPRVSLVFPAP